MAELLTQQEIDNLLSGMSTGEKQQNTPASQGDKPAREILTFDFRLPHRMSKNQLRTMQAVHESFGEMFASYLLGRLQTTVTIEVLSVDQLFYSEFVLSMGNPTCIYIFRIAGSEALGIMEFHPQLVLAIIERMLGGGSSGTEKKVRLITKIEQNIFKAIITRALADLQKAWKNVAPLTFVLERYETERDFAQIVPASEIVLAIALELAIEEEKFLINLCFPTFALEDVLAKLNIQQFGGLAQEKDGAWAKKLQSRIEQTTVGMVARLGVPTITLHELAHLSVGDVIRTMIPLNAEVEITVGDKIRFWGWPGISNGRKAVKITRIAHPSMEEQE